MAKIAISGKGGVGKTTLAALLAQVYADAGRVVLAVDLNRERLAHIAGRYPGGRTTCGGRAGLPRRTAGPVAPYRRDGRVD